MTHSTNRTSGRHQVRHRPFESFYRTERDPLVRALALTLGDSGLAADAVDEAMTRAFARWRSVGGYENPQGWIYRVALNWSRSRMRKAARELPGIADDRGRWDPEPPDPRLMRCVRDLPAHQRAVLVLRYYSDWSIDEIALALDVRPGTVKSRLNRALTQLRQLVEVER
jgi:RNA polymerase sigma-70 factor (ECF subfamily)